MLLLTVITAILQCCCAKNSIFNLLLEEQLVEDRDVLTSVSQQNKTQNETALGNNSSVPFFKEKVRAFAEDMLFVGEWSTESPLSLFNFLETSHGPCEFTYIVSPTSNTTRLLAVLSEDGYSDSRSVLLYFNLSAMHMSTNSSPPSADRTGLLDSGLIRAYLLQRGELANASQTVQGVGSATVAWTAPNGSAVDVLAVGPSGIRTDINYEHLRNGWNLRAWALPTPELRNTWLQPVILLVVALIVLMGNYSVAASLLKDSDHFVFANLGFVSTWMAGCTYVHFGAGFLGVAFNRSFSALESIPCLMMGFAAIMSSCICCLISMVACLHHYVERQLMGEPSNSRQDRWFLAGVVLQVGIFVSSSMFYSYRTPFIVTTCTLMWYPIALVIEAIYTKKRNSFNKWIHLLLWGLTIPFTYLMRGYGTSIVNLKPFPWLFQLQLFILILGVSTSYVQSKWSLLFFLPKSLAPGIHNYRTTASKLSDEECQLDCSICYSSIGIVAGAPSVCSPGSQDSEGLNSRLTVPDPIAEEVLISKPPCGHLFHEECLEAWLLRKPVCPLCRIELEL